MRVLWIFLTTSLASLAAPLAFADSDFSHFMAGNPKIDVHHYKVDVDATHLDFDKDFCGQFELALTVDINLTALADLSEIALHFNSQASTITSVQDLDSNEQLRFIVRSIQGSYQELVVTETKPILAGHDVTLRVKSKFHGALQKNLPKGGYYDRVMPCVSNFIYLNSYAYSFRSVIPSNDYLEDAATNEFIIHVPQSGIAAANGRLVAGTFADGAADPNSSGRLYAWSQEVPISTSVMSFMIKPRKNIPVQGPLYGGQIPVVVWSPYSQNELHWIYDSTQALEELIGPYPFAKLGVMGSGGMEYASLILGNFRHELVHQWWGNTVRPQTFGDGWISEGFTTYYDAIAGVLLGELSIEQVDSRYPPCTGSCQKLNAPFTQVNLIYDGGARCLHQLRRIVRSVTGESAFASSEYFFQFMRLHYEAHKFQAISSREFVEYVGKELGPFLHANGFSFTEQQLQGQLEQWRKDFFNPWVE